MTRRRPVLRPAERRLGTLLCALFAFGVADAAASPAPLSRGSAIATALAQNPRIAATAAGELAARAHRAQAGTARMPSIMAALATGPSLRAKLVPGSGVVSTENIYGDVSPDDLSIVVGGRLEVTQPLYTFGKIAERERAAEHELEARRAETNLTRADIAFRVAQIYEGLLFARDVEAFFDETAHWLSRTLEAARREVDAGGPSTEQDVARLEAARAAALVGQNQGRAGARQAEAGLVAYLVLSPGTLPPIAEAGLDALPVELPEPKSLVLLALQHRPELAALREGRAAYDALARAEAAGDLPDFFALAFASAAYTPGRDVADSRYVQDPLNGFYPGLLVGARWQLTPGMAGARADERRAAAAQLSELERFARSGIPAEVKAALEDLQRAKADLEAARPGVAAAKAWLVRAEADAAVGLGTPGEVTDAARAYAELRVVSLDAAFRHNVALAALARATGTLGDPTCKFYPGEAE
jgi:outer membrane protein